MGPSPGFTTAGAVTKTASNSTSPSRCFSNAADERLGAGVEKAWLDASKTVVSPPESSLVENTSDVSTVTGVSEPQAINKADAKGIRQNKL